MALTVLRLPRVPRLLLSVALAAGALVVLAPAAPAATVPRLVWVKDLPGAAIRESSPAIVDLDANGSLDVVVGSRDGRVHALRGGNGDAVAGWPKVTTHPVDSAAAVADVDGDGEPEVFIGSGSYAAGGGALYSFTRDGRVRFRKALKDRAFADPAVFATPALGDLDRNGSVDVAAASLGLQSVWALRANGVPLAGYPFFWDDTVFSSPALADVNGDGTTDIVIGGDSTPGGQVNHRGGMVRALTAGGRSLWEFRIDDIVRSSPSIGDIDGDGRPEVVFGGGDYYGGADSVAVFALDAATGGRKWRRATNGLTLGSPALADVDGDGRLDVAIATFPSNHGRGAGRSAYALRGTDGGDLPNFPQTVGGAQPGVVTADVDADGAQDLFVGTGSWVAVVNGRTGARMFNLAENTTTGFQSSPAVGDVDGDGRLDVIAAGTKADGTGVVFRWELEPAAKLGTRGWPQFRKDARRTGSWTSGVPSSASLAFQRRAGADRYATAATLSSGVAAGVDTVYVATGGAYADALAGGPAAAARRSAVLLVSRDAVPSATSDRLRELAPRRIVVLGGPAAVSDAVLAELGRFAPAGASRIAGSDRYATAAAISAATFGTNPTVAYVATGENFPDALAGAAAASLKGAPVLLVRRDAVPSSTSSELQRLRPQSIVVLGGTGSVSQAVETQLRVHAVDVRRVSGADRWATAVAASAASFPSGAATAYVATGSTFPDALAGGPVAASAVAPLLLVPGRCVPASVRAELDRLQVTTLVLLGGEGAVSAAVASLTPCG